MDLLLESEVAALLRRSRRFVRQLRQGGELRWMPGQGRAPMLIEKQSVIDYVDRTLQWQATDQPALRATRTVQRNSNEASVRRERALGQLLYRTKAATSK